MERLNCSSKIVTTSSIVKKGAQGFHTFNRIFYYFKHFSVFPVVLNVNPNNAETNSRKKFSNIDNSAAQSVVLKKSKL